MKKEKKTGYCTLPIILIIMDDSPRALFLEQRSRRKLGGDGGVLVVAAVVGGRGKSLHGYLMFQIRGHSVVKLAAGFKET